MRRLKESYDEEGRYLDYKPRITRPPISETDSFYRQKI